MRKTSNNGEYDQFSPAEAQERFEATLRAALNTPPKHRISPPAKRKAARAKAPASAASAKTSRRVS
jgi:hypothetical protein